VLVVLTRERGHNEAVRAWLPEGAEVIEVPLTTTRYFDVEDVRSTLVANDHFGKFQALVVTSSRSAAYLALATTALHEGGIVLSVGPATAEAMSAHAPGVVVTMVGRDGALTLSPAIIEGPVLLLGATSTRDELPAALRAKGLDVTELACYETRPAALRGEDEQVIGRADVIFIAAPSAWSVASPLVTNPTWVVVPGSTTATAVRATHERVIEGWGPELRGLLSAL
jgi:uroporphyrinogen-III synthase